MPAKRPRPAKKVGRKARKPSDEEMGESEEEEEDMEALKAKKEDFYKQVDKEEFF